MYNKNAIFIAFLTILSVSAQGQSYWGISGGVSKGTFLDYSNDKEYHAKYNVRSGASFSSFYETKKDSITHARIELQYKIQRGHIEAEYDGGHASFYKNINYSFQQLNLDLIYLFKLFEKRSTRLSLSFGPSLGYTLRTKSEGMGWEYISQTKKDINGNSVSIIEVQHWKIKESKSNDITKFNFGLETGMELSLPINTRFSFLIQNKYYLSLTNITRAIKYTSLFTGHLNIGVRYKFRE